MTKPAVTLKVSKATADCIRPDAPKDVKMLAASGKLPVEPGELLTALYFLSNDKDSEVRQAAQKSFLHLPHHILKPVLSSPETHPKVLGYAARLFSKETDLLEAIIRNGSADDATACNVAEKADAALLERITINFGLFSGRLPHFLEAIKKNPAVTPALLAKIESASEGDAGTADDEVFDNELIEEKEEPPEKKKAEDDDEGASLYKRILKMGTSQKIALAIKGNKEARGILVKEPNRLICGNVMKNPRLTESEVVLFAGSKTAGAEVFRAITMNRDWMKNYQIRMNLVQNPRVPLPTAMSLLNNLRDKDLDLISKSRNVSKGVANMAKRILVSKKEKKK